MAAAVGNSGLNTMLIASQFLLSVILPTVIFPLVYLCSQPDVMTVEGPRVPEDVPSSDELGPILEVNSVLPPMERRRIKSYTSPKWVTGLGYALFSMIVLANVYVFVELGLGNS